MRLINARYSFGVLDGVNILSNCIKIASLIKHMAGLYKIMGMFQCYIHSAVHSDTQSNEHKPLGIAGEQSQWHSTDARQLHRALPNDLWRYN